MKSLDDVSKLEFMAVPSIAIGTRRSECYTGPMIWRQGEQFIVVDPIEIGLDVSLAFDWWVGDPGITDFSSLNEWLMR